MARTLWSEAAQGGDKLKWMCAEAGANQGLKKTGSFGMLQNCSGKTAVLNLQHSGETAHTQPPNEWNASPGGNCPGLGKPGKPGGGGMPAGGSTADQNTLVAAIMEDPCMCQSQAATGCHAFLVPDILSPPDVHGTGDLDGQHMQHRAGLHPGWSQPATCRQQRNHHTRC